MKSGIRRKTLYLGREHVTPIALQQYCFMHAVHQEVDGYLSCVSGDAHPTLVRGQNDSRFYAACRSPQQRELEPFPTTLHLQQRSGQFRPFQCVRLLATIELPGAPVWKLPYDHDALLEKVRPQRQRETCD